VEVQLRVEQGAQPGQVFALIEGSTSWVGSAPGAQVRLADPAVAPQHAAIKVAGGEVKLVDLGAPGGSHLNGDPLTPQQPVAVGGGDSLAIGGHVLRFNILGAPRRRARTQRLGAGLLPELDFEIVGQIGAGGFGRVYSAKRRSDGHKVALKVLWETVGPEDQDRFTREGQIGQRLESPHIVRVIEHRFAKGRPCIVMDLVEGPSLKDRLAGGALPIDLSLRIARDVARALTTAAEGGIIHRDVKPANILLAPGGGALLTDFGIAKDAESSLRSLTRTGDGLGTAAYMAPEQVSGAKHVDARADLYALGATLYHMLGGVPPYDIQAPHHLAMVFQTMPTPLEDLRADCPIEVADYVHELLSREPQERPAVWDVAETLGQLLEDLPGLLANPCR
jgi:serine/threonine protein kinase